MSTSALGFEAAKGGRSSPGVQIPGSGDERSFARLLGYVPCVEHGARGDTQQLPQTPR